MRIKRVKIKNFRTLYDVTIDFHNITTFIGPNGSGKSTVLYALDWFFNGSKDGELTEEDATYNHADEPIEVSVTFNQLTDSDKRALGKYSPQGADEFTAWKTYDKGKEILSANSKGNPLFNDIKRLAKAGDKKDAYNDLQNRHPELNLPKAATASSINEAISAWEQSHSDQLEDIPEEVSTSFNGFNGNAAMKDIFNFTLVKADYRACEESEDSRNSILGSIIGRTVDRSAADERIQELYSGIEEQRKRIYDEIYGKKLDDLSCKLNSIIEGYSVGRTVSVISETQEIKPPKTNFGIRAHDGEDETEITKQGHGFQRMLLISALQLLAETSSPNKTEGTLCLAIEEPELYQHPIQALTFARVLRILGEDNDSGIQIMYDTHSPYFLEPQHYDQIYRFIRKHGKNTTVKLYNVVEKEVDEKLRASGQKSIKTSMGHIICNDLSSALFSNVVILVEGSSDKAILEEVANRYFEDNIQLSSTMALGKYGIQILPAIGKPNIPKLHAILDKFGITSLVMFDNDQSKKTGDVSGMAKENDCMSQYFRIEEECVDCRWPQAGLYSNNTIFVVEDNLEEFMKQKWLGWEDALSQSCDELNIDKNRNKKNEMAYRLAVHKLDIKECPSEIVAFLETAMSAARRIV